MDIEDQEAQFQPAKKPNRETESNDNGGGGLFFKVKAPKAESLDQDHHQNPAAPPQFTRTCEICHKGFSSGKALGGHMRMHVQANRELFKSRKKNKIQQKPTKSLKPNNNLDVSSSNGDGGFGIEGNNSSNNNMSNIMRPVCVECGKNFPSLKSLCGHMRSHPEREYRGIQPPQATIAAKNSSSSTLSDAVPDDDQKNDEYNKAHEDQLECAETTCVVGSKSCVVDLSKTLPGWSLTARRGRKSTGSSSANSESVSGLDLSHGVEEEQMEEAVHDLLMLAQASTCFNAGLEEYKGKGADQMCEATNSNFFITTNNNSNQEADHNKHKIQVTDYVSSSKKSDMHSQSKKIEKKWCDKYGGVRGKGVLRIGFGSEKSSVKNFLKLGSMEDNNNNNNIDEELSDSQNSESFVLGSMRTRKSKKMNFLDLERVVGGVIGAHSHHHQQSHHQHKLRYKCSLCGKSFPTHQALGGHMSSHNKLKNNYNSNIIIHHSSMDDQSASVDVSASEDGHNVDQTETAVALEQAHQAQHKCKICNKTFPTGQALGGHQRCHWTGPNEQLPPQPSQVASPAEASQNTGRKVLNFDLNELPSTEFEEGADQSGAAGYATSSYNSVA